MFDSIIAKEGQKSILIAFTAMIIFILLECRFLTFISFVLMLTLIYMYRYKYIDYSIFKENEYIAPISGTVSAIDVKDFKKSIYIDVSLCDSHILRSLESGNYKVSIKRGLNLLLTTLKAKQLNEHAKIEYTNSSMELYSSMCNSSININQDNKNIKSEKIGIFLQGQVIVNLNTDIETNVKIGDKVISGITLIATKKFKEENLKESK
ncbi:MAG: hypothetical protein C0625_03940 [Arcobacter sp.]|nr:MAG: hypothetical protein C0625_03940 [Arcobacter sp.]